MAMAWIWTGIVLLSFIYSLFAGTSADLGTAALDGAAQGVTLAISIAGPICLWCGVMEVMKRAKISEKIAKILRPAIKRLFPGTKSDSLALEAVSANVSANLLGLGNAATPLGIKAAELFSKASTKIGTATNDMCMLVVMNTASIQLIPTTVAAVRAGYGASSAFDILPAVWITSVLSVTAGIAAAKLFQKIWR